MARDVIYVEECEAGLRVVGCGCDHHTTTDTMVTCDDAILTPGDPCPAGRCPECYGLVYLDRPEDRAALEAGRLLAAVRLLADPSVGETPFRAALTDLRAILARVDAHD